MSKRRLICYTIALAAFFSAYVGYKFYESRTQSTRTATANQLDVSAGLGSMDRAFLQRQESVSKLPRDAAKQSPLLKPPVWTDAPEKWDSSAVDSVKVVTLPTDVGGFHAPKLSEGKTYRLPLLKEKTLIEGDIVGDQEIIHIIFTTPENTPEIPPPILEEVPIPYPLIANVIREQDDASLTQLRDWIKSVGGAARAQSLLEAAGLSDSIRIETVTVLRQ